MHNCTTDFPIPVLSSHTVANAHTAWHCLVSSFCPQAVLTCYIHLLGDLITLSPFFPAHSTYRWFWGQPLSWDKNSKFLSNFLWSQLLRRGFHTKPGFDVGGFSRLDCEHSLLEKVQRACWYNKTDPRVRTRAQLLEAWLALTSV